MADSPVDEDVWMSGGYCDCYYTGGLGRAWSKVHSSMERPYPDSWFFSQVVELGAGHGQHVAFVRHGMDNYVMTDLRQDLLPDSGDARVSVRRLDASDLSSIPANSFDRLIATCLLVHLPDPYGALRQWRRIVRGGGVLTIYVPLEPSLLNRLARRLFVWPRAKEHGAGDPELLHYVGHKVHYPALRTFLSRTFTDDVVSRRRYPSRFLPWSLGLYEIYQIRKSVA